MFGIMQTEMVKEDIKEAERDLLIRDSGFNVHNFSE